jgi:hypothetical protein
MSLKQWKTKVVKLSDMVPLENNPRLINPSALKGLKASLDRFGMVELIIWNERTKHIIGGNQRYAVLSQEGVIEVPVVVVDLDEQEELAASLTLNNPIIEGEFDEPIMELLDQVEKAAPELYEAVRMDDLKDSLEKSMSRIPDIEDETKEPEWDTECPCCGTKFKVESKDIVVTKGKE